MGSGKSTVGRDLADRLRRPHRDTDAAVVHGAGRSIPEIFSEAGEADFRSRESASLTDILDGPPAVVSTGGGIVVSEDNRRVLTDGRSLVVWLDASVEALVKRVKRGRGRPLLEGDVAANMRAKVSEREAWYSEVSDIRIDTTDFTRDSTVDRLLLDLEQESVL